MRIIFFFANLASLRLAPWNSVSGEYLTLVEPKFHRASNLIPNSVIQNSIEFLIILPLAPFASLPLDSPRGPEALEGREASSSQFCNLNLKQNFKKFYFKYLTFSTPGTVTLSNRA